MVRIIGSMQNREAMSDQLQWFELAKRRSIPKPLPSFMLSLCKCSSLKILKNRIWFSIPKYYMEVSNPFVIFLRVLLLLSDTIKHSSNTNFGIEKDIGFFSKHLTSGWLSTPIFGKTPFYIELNKVGFLPTLLSNKSGWLHTFLNYITRFIKFSIFFLLSVKLNKSFVHILLLIL